jgi:hypothetical protein
LRYFRFYNRFGIPSTAKLFFPNCAAFSALLVNSFAVSYPPAVVFKPFLLISVNSALETARYRLVSPAAAVSVAAAFVPPFRAPAVPQATAPDGADLQSVPKTNLIFFL